MASRNASPNSTQPPGSAEAIAEASTAQLSEQLLALYRDGTRAFGYIRRTLKAEANLSLSAAALMVVLALMALMGALVALLLLASALTYLIAVPIGGGWGLGLLVVTLLFLGLTALLGYLSTNLFESVGFPRTAKLLKGQFEQRAQEHQASMRNTPNNSTFNPASETHYDSTHTSAG